MMPCRSGLQFKLATLLFDLNFPGQRSGDKQRVPVGTILGAHRKENGRQTVVNELQVAIWLIHGR